VHWKDGAGTWWVCSTNGEWISDRALEVEQPGTAGPATLGLKLIGFSRPCSSGRFGDPDGEVGASFVAKELLREVFAAIDEAHARRRMIAFYTFCADADIPELGRLAHTISRWSELIFAYHRTGRASNGRTENVHMLIERPEDKPRIPQHRQLPPPHHRTAEHLGLISPQPSWQFESETDWGTGEAVALDDGRHGVEGTLVYTGADGARLEVSNPVVQVANGAVVLDEWGVDLGSGVEQPPLSQRLKLIGFSPMVDASSCFDGGMWAYIPGGVPTDVNVRIITIGRACSPNGGQVPQIPASRLHSEDGAVDSPVTTFLMQGGVDTVEVNTPTFYLAVFDLPRDAASANLTWETPFDRTDVPATSFHAWEIGPFDIDG
jgi:hypothetical protein